MSENQFETQYDVSKKSRLKKFYEGNKILIFSTILFLVIAIVSVGIFSETKKKKKILLAENYISAIVYLKKNDKNKAANILKTIIFANDKTYSSLSLFLILNNNLISDHEELSNLFDHVIENNKFDKETRNLIIFKKAIFQSNFVDESVLIELLKPLINTETIWRPHALLLLGDYFVSKQEFLKAKEFYTRILSLQNLNKKMYERARVQLELIAND